MRKRSICIEKPVHLSLMKNVLVIKYKDTPTKEEKSYSDEVFDRYFPSRKDGADVHVALEDISIIVADNPATSYSSQVLSAFAECGIVLIVCSSNHMPSGYLMPFEGHYEFQKVQSAQIDMGEAKKKHLWKRLIEAKIREQAKCLEVTMGESDITEHLNNLATRVASGDKGMTEALAARVYLSGLFGVAFERLKKREFRKNLDHIEEDYRNINICLNYGYTILRSLVARAIVSVGLNPSLGVFHSNQYNAFCLADDVMEPFRPLVDRTVWGLAKEGRANLSESKVDIINIIHNDVIYEKKEYPLIILVQRISEDVRDYIIGAKDSGELVKDIKIPSLIME